MQLPKQAGIAHIFLILIIIVVIVFGIVGYLFFKQTQLSTNVKGVNLIPKATPTSAPSPWKIYENEKYKFKITYPRVGAIWNEGELNEGECGNAIKEDNEVILVDNFYKLKKTPFEGTLEEYLTSQRAANAYEREAIVESGADEAIKLLGLKNGFEVAVGFPPLAYVKAIFKKGDSVFLIQEIVHNPSNAGGCVQPAVVDPTKYPEISNQNWDIVTNFKFF